MIKSNTVAAERRMDLASLFCMIGRHGPAVALAVVALVSVLAGFIIYRTVRGKRRKASAAADDGDGRSGGDEGDEAVIHPEECHSSAESTDLSDEGLSDAKEDIDLIRSNVNIRQRQTPAADRKPPRYSPPHIQDQDHKRTITDDTEEKPVAWDSYKAADTFAGEAAQSLRSDPCSEAPTGEEEAADYRGGATEDITEDVIEEVHVNEGWLKEPELMHEYHHEEEEKVEEAGFPEDVTTDEDVSDNKTSTEEDTFDMSKSDDDGGLQDTTMETNNQESEWKELDNHTEDEPVPCVPDGKDHQPEEENLAVTDYSYYTSSNGLSQVKNEVDEEVECVDCQQEETWVLTAEEETKLPTMQQDQCGFVLDEVIQDGDLDEDAQLAGEVIEGVETQKQCNKQEVEIALHKENNCMYTQEDGVPYDCVDPTEGKLQANIPDLSSDCQEPQREGEIVQCVEGEAGFTVFKTIDNDLGGAADPDPAEHPTDYVIIEEISCPHLPSMYQDEQSGTNECNEPLGGTMVNSVPHAPACDHAAIASPMISEETHYPDMSPSQDHESDYTKPNDLPEAVTSLIGPPTYQMHLPSFEQSEQRDNDIISPGIGEESGISSMAVSPDMQDAGREFEAMVENMMLPVIYSDLQPEEQQQTQDSLPTDDVAVSVDVTTAGMVFGSYPLGPSQSSNNEHTDWTHLESYATNEDFFGHEVEESYHKMLDQLADQMAASATSFTNELTKQTDMKVVVEVVELTENKAGVSVEVKKVTKGEKEEEEENYEKTEISIMEATMDYNEWITDSNCQTLPWMNLSVPSFPQDKTKPIQPPTEECSAGADVTSEDAPDVPQPTEVKQANAPSSPLDENYKKVVAVQPMPQNVNVTFSVHYFTHSPYQTVAVTGDQQELGNWKGFVPLERAKDGHWTVVVSLPAESIVEWKFVVVDRGEVCRWEECGNRLLDTGYGEDLLVHKWWGLL